MATEAGGGDFWKLILGAIPGIGALGWAIFKQMDDKGKSTVTITHERSDEDAALRARANLDDAQKEWFDAMRTSLQDERAARKEAQAECDLWEARARRADRGWLELVQQFREERVTGVRRDIPPVPRLEDPVI